MNRILKLSASSLVVIVGFTFLYSVLLQVLGDHKLCDGMKLKEIPDTSFSVSFNSQLNLLHLEGPLEIGIVTAFKKTLAKFPDATGVILDSAGGNIYQARGIAKIIQSHSLDTYSLKSCYSACTVVYIAGTIRYLGAEAKLGFHNYRLDSKLMQPLVDIEKEQKKDLAFFEKQIPDVDFIKNIFNHAECPDIWVPDIDELLDAGVVHEILIGSRSTIVN